MPFQTIAETWAGAFINNIPSDFLRYAIGAGGVFLIVNVALAGWIAHRRIQPRGPAPGQIRREILSSLRTVLVFAAVGAVILTAAQYGLIPLYTDIGAYGWPWLIASTLLLIVLHDAWFYWTHWLLHHPRLFRTLHGLHHRSRAPTPFAAYAFDTGEALVNAAYFPLALALIPSHPIALLIFTSHMMLRNAIGHCGLEIFPRRADGRPLFDWMTTVTHHDLHHEYARWNFGLYFTWWDRWMGTEHPDYIARFRAASRPRPTAPNGPARRPALPIAGKSPNLGSK